MPGGFCDSRTDHQLPASARHDSTELPGIRSERTSFELHYPWINDRMRAQAHIGRHSQGDAITGAGPWNRQRGRRNPSTWDSPIGGQLR